MSQIRSLPSICLPCRQKFSQTQRLQSPSKRFLTSTPPNRASPIFPNSSARSELDTLSPSGLSQSQFLTNHLSLPTTYGKPAPLTYKPPPEPHKLNIYATKHNCHITLATGARQPILSVSAGNIGFKKAARGTYDAAYQLGAFVMGRIQQLGLLSDPCPDKRGPVRHVELVLRGFGPGREAVTKILMGVEGKSFRERIWAVKDNTRLKFGGARSPRPRRLG